MGPFSMLRGAGLFALAAALSPFVFFALLILMVLGVVGLTMGPLIFAFVAMILLRRWAKSENSGKSAPGEVIEARIVREEPPPFPAEAYTPPVHFDLLLDARRDIGRIIGAAGAITDAAVSRQFSALAAQAERVLALVIKEPAKLGLARRFFASYLPRAADLAASYHRIAAANRDVEGRKTKLLDVLYRLEHAMKDSEETLAAPELARIDADMKILANDLKDVRLTPDFGRAPEPIIERVDDIVRTAKRRNVER